MVEHTQQDVLETVQNMIDDYNYHIEQSSDASCDTTYIVVEKDNVIAGCIGITHNIIKHLRTEKKFRRCGIGTSLLHKAESIIKARGHMEAIAFVHCDNKASISLFDKNDYIPVKIDDCCYYLRRSLY